MKKTAKKDTEKKPAGSGAAIAGSLIGLGLLAVGVAVGYAVGSEKQELEHKVRKLDRRTKKLKEMYDDAEERSRKLRVVTPDGSFPLFDQNDDIEA